MKGFFAAIRFITVLPLGRTATYDPIGMIGFFPVVGLLIGGMVAIFDGLATSIWPLPVVSLIDVILLVVLTGALHVDGLADTADGILAHHSRENALAIMKDSRIGVMGMAAVVCALGLKWGGLSALTSQRALIITLIPAYARMSMIFAVRFLDYARPEGGTGHPLFKTPLSPSVFWCLPVLMGLSMFLGWRALLLNTAFLAITAITLWYYRKRMGGVTGDMLGALVEIAESMLFHRFGREWTMIVGHGGNVHEAARQLGCRTMDIVDMSSNINPIGPPPGLIEYLRDQLGNIHSLPEADALEITLLFADSCDVAPEQVLAGNGTTQFIYSLPIALDLQRALILGPTYADYEDACTMHGVAIDYCLSEASRDFLPDLNHLRKKIGKSDAVFICNPNNPTGALIPAAELEHICRDFKDQIFVIDESYLPFAENGMTESMIPCRLPNVIVLNSMSKVFRIPGLRIGFLVASEEITAKFRRYYPPWSVNSLAQAAVDYLITHTAEMERFKEKTRQLAIAERAYFSSRADRISGLRLFPSATLFMLAELTGRVSATEICELLLRRRFLVRNCSNFKGLSERFIRISLKTRTENKATADTLGQFLASEPPLDRPQATPDG